MPKERLRYEPGAVCAVNGCGGAIIAKRFCGRHYSAFKKHGDPLASRPKRADFTGSTRADGYTLFQQGGVKRLAHVLIAERALGKPLPAGAVVHHADENPSNNAPTNLVICPSQAYHVMLHKRMRAMNACGNPNWVICPRCKRYDDPAGMRSYKSGPGRKYTTYTHTGACPK